MILPFIGLPVLLNDHETLVGSHLLQPHLHIEHVHENVSRSETNYFGVQTRRVI